MREVTVYDVRENTVLVEDYQAFIMEHNRTMLEPMAMIHETEEIALNSTFKIEEMKIERIVRKTKHMETETLYTLTNKAREVFGFEFERFERLQADLCKSKAEQLSEVRLSSGKSIRLGRIYKAPFTTRLKWLFTGVKDNLQNTAD